jgi:hypothetical protein
MSKILVAICLPYAARRSAAFVHGSGVERAVVLTLPGSQDIRRSQKQFIKQHPRKIPQ